MDEMAENRHPTIKRSRSDEELKIEKDASSSSSDTGHHSPPHSEQNVSGCNNNISSNNNSDSGLSCKMEDSSYGDGEVPMAVDSTKMDEADQKAATERNVIEADNKTNQDKNMEDVDVKAESNKVGSDNSAEEPCTSSNIIKRSKRNRSRNYRVAGRSTSTTTSLATVSPDTSGDEVADAMESTEATGQDVQGNEGAVENAADGSSPTSHRTYSIGGSPTRGNGNENDFPPEHLNSPSDSPDTTSSDDDSDEDDDDTDFSPSLFGDRLSFDYASPDSGDSAHSARINERDEEVNKLLNKPKPSYTWNAAYELMRREHGLSGDGKSSLRNGFTYGFNNRFYASRHIVERMKLSHVLRKHNGCVNSLNFNKNGDLLVTGSDDARLIIWDWAGNKVKHIWKSGHSSNIFQSKFVPSSSCIDIISAARDGRVRRSIVPSAGGKVQTSNIYIHRGPVHKLVICPDSPWEIISVGEDGFICSKDLREENNKNDMLQVMSPTKKSRKVRLFSISHHPFAPEICVSGSDSYVRVYDKRSMKEPVHTMCPEHILEACTPNVTCCVYNNTGTEILASYSEDNIYLFDNKNYVNGKYLHCYKGHYNQKTIKGVNFFGPNCEYVISGSDCGNIFYWDKNTEAILNFMPGDTSGVVNCLEPHPNTPILATSGLDHHIKIWTPSAEKYPPDLTKLIQCVRRNLRRTAIDDGIEFGNSQLQYFIRQIICHRGHRNRERERERDSNRALAGSDDSDSDDDSSVIDAGNDDSDDDVDVSDLQRLNCGTQ